MSRKRYAFPAYLPDQLPTINPLSGLITLVSGVVSGVNTVFAQITGYNVFGGSAAGATVSVIAIARSDVPSN